MFRFHKGQVKSNPMEFPAAYTDAPFNLSNLTSKNGSWDGCSRDNVLKTIVFPVLYSILFLLGLLLNALAVRVFFSIPSNSHFIIYLKNIVVADVIMTFTFPFKILSDSNVASVTVRVFVCRVSSVLFYLTMYISILFFGLISIDRCRKTLRPFVGTNTSRLARRKVLSGLIWASLFVLCLPNMVLTSRPPTSVQFKCSDLKTQMGLYWHEVVNYVCQVIFWTNLVTVVICYTLITKELYSSYARTRARRMVVGGQVRANVFLVLGVFFVCFVPFHFARVPYTMSQTQHHKFDCKQKLIFFQLKESTLWLSSLNSLLDPLIYFFLCKSFRNSLFSILRLSPGRCRAMRELLTDSTAGGTPLENSTAHSRG
ncbi:P2Y purinoceptor 12-like [Chanos chanos]|uniref:P2Y purinoceptor 12-like n=1 Tax=Chanos chanos TaxID=29144 RepID=A0A6J2VQ57_CHACN|nr:P2Y purinoceptor 12-like [Chanos chanos]